MAPASGAGMQSGPGYATRMSRTLYEMGINIELMATREMCITCLIDESPVAALAAAAWHTGRRWLR